MYNILFEWELTSTTNERNLTKMKKTNYNWLLESQMKNQSYYD